MDWSHRDVFHRHFYKNPTVSFRWHCMYRLNNSSSQQTAELISGTKVEQFPNWKKTRPDQSPSHSTLSRLKMYYAAYLTQWNVKCSYFSCPMKQMDFPLCLLRYYSQAVSLHVQQSLAYNGCHGHKWQKLKNVQFVLRVNSLIGSFEVCLLFCTTSLSLSTRWVY